jgi:hypothetical protein
MRRIAIVLGIGVVLAACPKGENSGVEEAKKEAEKEQQEREKASPPVKKLVAPVPNMQHVSCARLINLDEFQKALGEKEPLSIKEQTKGDAEAAASCGIVRGGKKLTANEQAELLKKEGRLGIMPQDVICDVSVYCWTIEDPVKFKERCKRRPNGKFRDDDTMGNYSCVQITETGKYDVQSFWFYDDDTKCTIKVRGGASQTNNDIIRTCAKVARDTIGPAQIIPGDAPPPTPPTGSGSGAGGATGSGA